MICNNCGKQSEPNDKFCQKCGTTLTSTNHKDIFIVWLKKHKKLIISVVIILVIVVIISIVINIKQDNNANTDSGQTTTITQDNSLLPATTAIDQDKIISSVVNIWCPDGDNVSGGSGTLWTSDGLILTNAHIIPQDSSGNPISSDCLVTLPNSQGATKDEYSGEPIIIPAISKEYDLAFIKIDGPYTDKYGVDHGPYPTTFPDYPDFGCENDAVTLGEAVTVFGYPEISDNGNALTITTGVVSSLPGDGTIITSAKVAHGDSGGLAVDENGCMIGVPSMVSADEDESLGIIKDYSTVESFFNDAQDYANK